MLLSRSWSVLLSSALFWLLISLLVGLVANRLPPQWLQTDPPLHQLPAPARTPVIRAWKRWIPDAGPALPGGIAKARLVARDPAILQRLVIETRRAELVHWLLLPGGLLTALWLPSTGVVVNVGFALVFNLPCLLIQRYNRRRVQRLIRRFTLRASSAAAERPDPPRSHREGSG
jgi:glycosyl-4,4'-diaponeurosporenoate acyltransferase